MTNEDARNVVECMLTNIVGENAHKKMEKGVKNTFEALEKAEEALEKQIPKKAFHSGITYDCPKCLETVGKLSPSGKLMFVHHCKCGQAIDWSEVE